MTNETLRMQFLSGVITEGQYKIKLHENVAVAEVRRAMEAAIAKIKNPTDIERRINNVKFVVYNSLDPNTNGGERPPSDFQFDDAWWDSTHSQATDSVIASIYGELDAAVKGKSFGEDPMNENKSLNESMIGGIVGIGAINQIPPRAKADYETAFEHFLGKKYGLNEEMEVMVDSNMLKSYFNELISLADDMEYTPEMVDELKNLKNTLQGGKISVENALDLMQQTVDITEDDIDAVEALSQAVDNDDAIIDKAREIYGLDEGKEVKIEEGKEEVVLSNKILNFLEERGIIDPSDAQKVHTDLTAFLEDKIKPEKSSQEKNYDPQYSQDPRERYDSGGSQPGH